MAEKVTFDGATKTITVNAGETQIDVGRDLYSAWKRWVYSGLGAQWDPAFRTFGGDITSYDAATDTTQYAPRYYFLINDWQVVVNNGLVVNFESNLYTDREDNEIYVVTAPSSVRARNNDLTILAAGSSQLNEYGGWVYLDTSTANTGSAYPVGTPSQPVNNLPDAVSIASQYNIHQIEIRGTVNVTQDLDGFYIKGGAGYTLLIMNGYSNNQTEFSDMYIAGDLGPDAPARFEVVGFADGITNIDGVMDRCAFAGVAYPRENCSLLALNPSTKRDDSYHSTFDFTNVTDGSFYMYGYNGSTAITNLTSANINTNFGFSSGSMEIYDTCTAGTIQVGGIPASAFENNVNGATVTAKLLASQESLDELQAVLAHTQESLDYGSQIVYDNTSTETGTDYPVGTHEHPVNNLADAITIMEARGIHKLHIHTDLDIDQDFEGYLVEGVTGREVVVIYGVSVERTFFNFVYLAGAADGLSSFRAEQCVFAPGFQNFGGVMNDCGIAGDISLVTGTAKNTMIKNSVCASANIAAPIEVSLQPDPLGIESVYSFRGFYGSVKLTDLNQANQIVKCNIDAGKLVVDSTCIDGTIRIAGIPIDAITDNNGGATVITTNTLPGQANIASILAIVSQFTLSNSKVLAYLDEDTKQIIRDAMALGTSETPELDSIDHKVDRIDENTQE